MIKLHIHYLYTEKPGCQFARAKLAKKRLRKSNFSGKDTSR